MEEYKKKIQKKLVIMRIMGTLFLLILIAVKIFLDKKDTSYSGLLAGGACGMIFVTIGYCVRFSNALKDEKKLKAMYIQETDERNKEIAKKTMATSSMITLYVTAFAVFISGIFSDTVAMTLAVSIIVDALITAGVSAYYNQKL